MTKKMVAIFSDITKFECLGPVNQFDNTAQNETKLQHRLLQLVKSDNLPKTIYEVIRDPLAHNDQECMDFQKFTNKMCLALLFFR